MTTTYTDHAMKNQLLDAAARLLAEEGTGGLTTRKISASAGTTTMSVYTHFGSIKNLVDELVISGFNLLWAEMQQVEAGTDDLAHLAGLTAAYLQHARQHPALYRIMFGTIALGEFRPVQLENMRSGKYTLELVVQTVQRLIDAGRIEQGNAFHLANEWWVVAHGYVMLELTGYFEPPNSMAKVLAPLLTRFLLGLGAAREQVDPAIQQVFSSERSASA